MASSLTPSASTNPFSTQPEEENDVLRPHCRSPHNPFSLHARASSPGNPFAPSTSPPDTPSDEVLPFTDVCEPMQSMKLEDIFPDFEGNPHSTTTSDGVAATWSATDYIADMPELVENACTTTTSSAANDFVATYVSSSDFPKTHLSKPTENIQTNHVADSSSSAKSTWGNNTNNSNHVERTERDDFGDGFQDDFGSLSHTDVIFKTGFMDNSFKAVAVTAEEDDLWSSSFIMEDPSPDGENFQSSRDQESTEQGAETPTQTDLGIQFDSFQISGATLEVEEQNTGLSNTNLHLDIDLPNFADEPWDPWPPGDFKDQPFVQDQSTSNHAQDPWAPSSQTSEQSQRTENSQAYGIGDVFSMEGSDPWGVDTMVDAEKERRREVDMFGQDPWTQFESTKEAVDQKSVRPQTLELSAPFGNPFSSEGTVDSCHQQGSSPFQDDRSSPFHHHLNPTSHSPDASQSLFPGASQLQAFGAHSDPWSSSLTPDNQEGNCSRGSRSPNPFSPVEDSANPFLQDLELLPGKLGRTKQSKIPDIPKFEEENLPSTSSNKKEGASTSAVMEGAAADPQVFSNGTDTLDVADHDDIFDMNGSAEVTQTDDEFENNERMMEEEEEDTKKEFAEVEDIFQTDNHVADATDIENANMSKEKEEVQDIFGDDLHVKEEPDYEPIFTADAREEKPAIKITDADTEQLEPEVSLKAQVNVDNEAEVSELDVDLPFPDMPRKSDISLNWEEVMEEEQKKQQQQQISPPTSPPANTNAPPSNVDAPPISTEEQEEEIDEGEVAKFVEKILISSMNEVSSQAEEQESESQIENVVEVEASEPAVEAPETTVDSENVLSLEMGPKKVDVDVVNEPAEKEDISVSVEALASEHADISGLAKDQNGDERELEIHTDVPVSVGEVAKEVQDVVQERPSTDFKDTLVLDLKDSPAVESSSTLEKSEERSKSPDTPLCLEIKPEMEVTKNIDSSEGRQRKMSVPRPRDVRKDLSEARPSFFGSSTVGPKPFMSNTLPRVSVLPRISTSYQRKSPTSPMSFSGDYSSSFDKDAEELPKELPTVAGPDLSKDDTQVIKELGTIELPHIETLSKPSSPKVATVASAKVDANPVVPAKETKVESGPMAPVYARGGAGKDPIVLDGTSPEEIEAIFAKDPEEEPKKKSMGKDDVIASTRVRKVSRTTWKGQDEFQKSVEKSAVVLDEPQAASLRKYEERRKQRIEGFSGKYRTREDSTSEAESEGSQSSQSGPKMPDVVQSGGSVSSHVNPESEVVAPKLNMKSVRSLWEQKAAEVEQRRRSLQTKSRPVSQGEKYRPSNSKNIKSCDGSDNLDDSIEGSTTYSYDGTSDDGSVKRESLIERDIRLQKERDLEITKERDRLRSESTSSRDESQQSETSETQDDQVVDIVRDAELRRDSDDGRSSPSQSSGYTSGRSTPSTPAGDDILKAKSGKSSGKTPELKMSLSPTDPEASSNYKEYQKALRGNKTDKFSKSATFPRRMENFDKQAESSGISPTNSVGDVPDVIMVDSNKSTSPSDEKPRKSSIVQQGIKLSQKLEQKKIAKLEKKPRRSLMELEIAAQREKEEAFRREQQTRKMSTSKSVGDEAQPASSASSTTTSPSTTPQNSPRKTSVSGPTAKQVYKDLNYAPHTSKKKLALAGHWEHKWK